MAKIAPKNYTLGRGEVFFARFLPGGEIPEGERYLGNTPEFTITFESENLDHFSSDRGIREKDDSVILEVTRSGAMVCDDIQRENVALFFFGSSGVVAQGAATITDELIEDVILGRTYQLGEDAADPVGVMNIVYPGSGGTLFEVTNSAGSTTYVAGDDYVLEPETGRLTILEGGDIVAASDIKVTYTTTASSFERILSGSTPVEGKLRFIARNPKGANINYVMPKVTLRPNGDYSLKGDDWQSIPFSIEILRKGALEAIYANGRAYTP